MTPFLTEHNTTYTEDLILSRDEDVHYCCLDYSSLAARDFIFPPLIYLDLFRVEALAVEIAGSTISLPRDWSIVIGDRDFGWLETANVEEAITRDLEALVYNPLSSSMPGFAPLRLKAVGEVGDWAAPRLRKGNLLCVPLNVGDRPDCIVIAHDVSRCVGDGEIDIAAIV